MQTHADRTSVCHYFVDEAGDTTLFAGRGRVLVGQPGCSRFFMLGLCQIGLPDDLHRALEALRSELLLDPYFTRVPSMGEAAQKTARSFHAKDDLPEVRREVFRLLATRSDLRFFAVIRDKHALLAYVRHRNARDAAFRYDHNSVYEELVRRLFRDRLHKAEFNRVLFARRVRADRSWAVLAALARARDAFESRFGKKAGGALDVTSARPSEHAGLQAVDYCLWALQRLYERGEDRFLAAIWPSVRLIVDADDRGRRGSGEHYTQRRPLTLQAVERRNATG